MYIYIYMHARICICNMYTCMRSYLSIYLAFRGTSYKVKFKVWHLSSILIGDTMVPIIE